MAEAIIELKSVERHYVQGPRKLTILNGADFSLRRGEMVALVAPSGTGKSTLLHTAGLLERPENRPRSRRTDPKMFAQPTPAEHAFAGVPAWHFARPFADEGVSCVSARRAAWTSSWRPSSDWVDAEERDVNAALI